jgi:uncharacterized DUF497 family protein
MSNGVYQFDWDAAKAATNEQKHEISFELAMTVFRDRLALTVFDEEHSDEEERWVSIGVAENGMTLVVIHTFTPTTSGSALIRIISARRARLSERKQYEEG